MMPTAKNILPAGSKTTAGNAAGGSASSTTGNGARIVSLADNNLAEGNFDNYHNDYLAKRGYLKDALKEHKGKSSYIKDAYPSGLRGSEMTYHILQADISCNIVRESLELLEEANNARRNALLNMKNYHHKNNCNSNYPAFKFSTIQGKDFEALKSEANNQVATYDKAVRDVRADVFE